MAPKRMLARKDSLIVIDLLYFGREITDAPLKRFDLDVGSSFGELMAVLPECALRPEPQSPDICVFISLDKCPVGVLYSL